MRIGIVGAGLAGLSAARRLSTSHGGAHEVVVLDKGRSPGGRMATRRLDDAGTAVADHGAQFFTVRDEAFAEEVATWPVRVWHHGAVTARSVTDDPSSADVPDGDGDGHPRRVGVEGMNAITRHLAEGLDVRCGVPITGVRPARAGWELVDGSGEAISVDRVLLTPPVPQSLAMLPDDLVVPDAVRRLSYEPCLGLLVTLDGPSGLPSPGAVQFDEGPIRFLGDNQAKGISTAPALTIHAHGDWSAAHIDDSDEDIADKLWQLARPWLTAGSAAQQVKRWRYATPTNPHDDRAVALAEGVVVAGDAFGGPKVEGAVQSGWAAADLLTR